MYGLGFYLVRAFPRQQAGVQVGEGWWSLFLDRYSYLGHYFSGHFVHRKWYAGVGGFDLPGRVVDGFKYFRRRVDSQVAMGKGFAISIFGIFRGHWYYVVVQVGGRSLIVGSSFVRGVYRRFSRRILSSFTSRDAQSIVLFRRNGRVT